MRYLRNKILIVAFAFLFLVFFSNDFNVIDIEKTAIITALALDVEENGEYSVTAQIAVPEATDTNTESKKTQITGKGSTVGSAIKNVSDISGWFPNLYFCNLIILGEGLKEHNLMKTVDYFSRTLRIQDSAVLIFADGSAKELLDTTSPLDNISSFALQKVLLRIPGFNLNIANTNVKSFAKGYYSIDESSYMPLVKVLSQESSGSSGGSGGSSSSGGSGSSGGSSSGDSSESGQENSGGSTLYDATTTLLFNKGKVVGKLDKDLTLAFNSLKGNIEGTTIEVNDVTHENNTNNYFVNILRNNSRINLNVNQTKQQLDISLDLFCKIMDQNTESSKTTYAMNTPIAYAVKEKMESMFKSWIEDLILAQSESNCDLLKVKQTLYRYNYKYYNALKDDILKNLTYTVTVNVSGEK